MFAMFSRNTVLKIEIVLFLIVVYSTVKRRQSMGSIEPSLLVAEISSPVMCNVIHVCGCVA